MSVSVASAWARDPELLAAMQQLRSFGSGPHGETISLLWQRLQRNWWRVAKTMAANEETAAAKDARLDWPVFIRHVWADSAPQMDMVLSGVFAARWRELRNLGRAGGESPAGRAVTSAVKLGLLPGNRREETPWLLLLHLDEAAVGGAASIFKVFNDWWRKAGAGKMGFLEALRTACLDRHGRDSLEPPRTVKDDVLAAMRALDPLALSRKRPAAPEPEPAAAAEAAPSSPLRKRPRLSVETPEQPRRASSVPSLETFALSADRALSLPAGPMRLAENRESTLFVSSPLGLTPEPQPQQQQQQQQMPSEGRDLVARLRARCAELVEEFGVPGSAAVAAVPGGDRAAVRTLLFLAGELAAGGDEQDEQ